MIISNDLGSKTLLSLTEKEAISDPPETEAAVRFARAALKREEGNLSGREGNVRFLKEWIKAATTVPAPVPVPVPNPVPVSKVTPPDKTTIRVMGQPWEKDKYLREKGEEIDA